MLKRLVLPLILAFALAPAAQAAGGRYVFDGGTRAQRGQVASALGASSFDWNLVPGRIVIHIGKGISSHAVAGQIWLDGRLLNTGRFSWGVVQHEYAHQVDFLVLSDPMRAQLQPLLQDTEWWARSSSMRSSAASASPICSRGPTGSRPTTSCSRRAQPTKAGRYRRLPFARRSEH